MEPQSGKTFSDSSTQTESPETKPDQGPFTAAQKRVILRLFAYIIYRVRIKLSEYIQNKNFVKAPVPKQPNRVKERITPKVPGYTFYCIKNFVFSSKFKTYAQNVIRSREEKSK